MVRFLHPISFVLQPRYDLGRRQSIIGIPTWKSQILSSQYVQPILVNSLQSNQTGRFTTSQPPSWTLTIRRAWDEWAVGERGRGMKVFSLPHPLVIFLSPHSSQATNPRRLPAAGYLICGWLFQLYFLFLFLGSLFLSPSESRGISLVGIHLQWSHYTHQG